MLQAILRAIGFGLCHQLPERSFIGGGIQIPVCARDTGIYVGFVVSALLLGLLHRSERPSRFATPVGWTVIALFFASMVVDGVTSYGGLRETTNLLRLATGTAAGFAIAAVVIPLINAELWAVSTPVRVLTPVGRLIVWTLGMPVVVLAVWFGGPLIGVWYPIAIAVSIAATFVTVNMLFAAILPAFDRAARRWRDLLGPMAVGVLLTIVEAGGAAALRLWLDTLARSVG